MPRYRDIFGSKRDPRGTRRWRTIRDMMLKKEPRCRYEAPAPKHLEWCNVVQHESGYSFLLIPTSPQQWGLVVSIQTISSLGVRLM